MKIYLNNKISSVFKINIVTFLPQIKNILFKIFSINLSHVSYSFTDNYAEADIILTFDQFDFTLLPKKLEKNKKYIHFTYENIEKWPWYKQPYNYVDYLHKNNYNVVCIGTYYNNNWNCIYFPESFYKTFNNHNKDNFEERYQNNICHIYRQPYPHRVSILKHYNSVNLKCNNNTHINDKTTYIDNKIKLCEKYLYNIAVENSQCKSGGYITEKVSDAILAGCIPIYWGGDLKQFTAFNLDRIITITDLDKYPKLSTDKIYLKDKFDLPVLNENYDNYLNDIIEKIIKFVMS